MALDDNADADADADSAIPRESTAATPENRRGPAAGVAATTAGDNNDDNDDTKPASAMMKGKSKRQRIAANFYHAPMGPVYHNNLQASVHLPSDAIYPHRHLHLHRGLDQHKQQEEAAEQAGKKTRDNYRQQRDPLQSSRQLHNDKDSNINKISRSQQSKQQPDHHHSGEHKGDRSRHGRHLHQASEDRAATTSTNITPADAIAMTVDGRSSKEGDAATNTQARLPFVYRKDVTVDDVMRERAHRRKLEQSNCKSLSKLGVLASDFTHRLDTTYYSLLETITSLRSGIDSFHNLTNLVSDVHSEFNLRSKHLERDHSKQIAEFKGFRGQVKRIEALEERMRAGREKYLELDQRLDVVRGKIEAWDRRESEWQARVSRRLRILWGLMGMVALLVAAIGLFERIRPVPERDVPDAATTPTDMTKATAATTTMMTPSGGRLLQQNLSSTTLTAPLLLPSILSARRRKLEALAPWLQCELGGDDHNGTPHGTPCMANSESSATRSSLPQTTSSPQDFYDPLQRVIDEL